MEVKTVDYTYAPPKNETYEHFTLKQIGRLWLYLRGCRYVGTEIYVRGIDTDESKKEVIDACGVDKLQQKSYGVEAKQSISDFKNGYCARCNYTYVIVPKGLITKDDTPPYVGIIEVDIPNFRFVRNAKDGKLKGLTVLKKARYHVNDYYYIWQDGVKTDIINEDLLYADVQRLAEYINRSNTNELIYNNPYIPMEKIVVGSRRFK